MIEELVDYKNWNNSKKKIDIINQIEINLKANRSVEPNHPKFPSLELFCHIYEISLYFSDYIAANLMKINSSVFPPPLEKPKDISKSPKKGERKLKHHEEEDDDISDVSSQPSRFKYESQKGRGFEVEDDKQSKNIFKLPIEETKEYEEEDGEVGEEDEARIGEVKSMDHKSISDIDEAQGNQNQKNNSGPSRVDQRILLFFDKMRITIGEVATDKQKNDKDYDGIIDTYRSEIPHFNILEMILEGLEIEYDSGTSMNLRLIMTRLYMKDLQKVPEYRKGLIVGAKSLIPQCYQMILSNPDIEKDYDDDSSHFSINTRTVRTEDFMSINNDNDSVADFHPTNANSQLKLYVKMEDQTTDVEFIFITTPILERLSKFAAKIQTLQKEGEEAKIKAKINEVNRVLNEEDELDSESDEEAAGRVGVDKSKLVLASQFSEIQKRKDIEKQSKGLFQRLREERDMYKMQGRQPKIKIINQNTKMNARGRLKNFEIWVPLDPTDEYSRVLSLSLSMQVSYRNAQLIKHKINEITNQLIESNVYKNQQDANLMISQLMIMMYNRHLLQVQDSLTSEKLLLPSRINLVYDRLYNRPTDVDITNVELIIEPFDLKVGFRELDNLKNLQKLMNDFQARINQKSEEENNDEKDDYEKQISKQQAEEEENEKDMIKNLEEQPKQTKERVSFKDIKSKQIIKMNIRFISESLNFSLMDDTGLHEYPLINFNISKIMAQIEQETGRDDAASFILKKMGISEHSYLKVDAALLLESNYFNVDSGSYEPLIEPWTFNSIVKQKTLKSAMEIELRSDEMLNMSVTYGMALALRNLMNKMSQQSNQWENEKQVEDSKTKSKRFTQTKQFSSNKYAKTIKSLDDEEDEEARGFVFENNLGVAMRITIENYDTWLEQQISFNEEEKELAVIQFQEWEEGDNSRMIRNLRDLTSLNKYVKKEQNGGRLVENYEDQIIRYDIYISGYEPVVGVPIEITGHRSYELIPEGEKALKKKPKYQNSLIVYVKSEGNKKLISFESQLIISNKT